MPAFFKRLSSGRRKREELRSVLPQLSVSEGIFEIRLRTSASLKAGTAGVNISAARIHAPGARIKEGVPGRQTEFFIRTPSLIKLSSAHSLLGRDYFWCEALSVGDSCTLRSHTYTHSRTRAYGALNATLCPLVTLPQTPQLVRRGRLHQTDTHQKQ